VPPARRRCAGRASKIFINLAVRVHDKMVFPAVAVIDHDRPHVAGLAAGLLGDHSQGKRGRIATGGHLDGLSVDGDRSRPIRVVLGDADESRAILGRRVDPIVRHARQRTCWWGVPRPATSLVHRTAGVR
jgi:hypothetical protein